ncbi:unnamed protein product [Kuraishia capsulata CBS 1993]|uniref:Ubiquinol-cytochrome c chaperone domain-containing protein n=1 Tax=Kuraishia capsulata CBS 1993 TaxID=1382522 RepID=W6MM79_9ASCO|nr:uncharacterized protein KUCA_T00003281001 [Kuraishia capsulata CBS 1993]CDK27303.1 unnamed protein product [Kuraishia capsulata CBS 1993]
MKMISGMRSSILRSAVSRPSLSLVARFNSTKVGAEKSELFEAPATMAKASGLPNMAEDLPPNKDIPLSRKLAVDPRESKQYSQPQWKESLGETFISLFRVNMDNVRSGSIGGSKYYYMTRDQGLQYADEELSDTARYWYDTLGLPRTFSQWFQITSLHIWILFVRMRAMPFKEGKNYQQKLVDRFFKDMELRLSEEMNVMSGRIIDTYLRDFHSQLLGIIMSYDEGIATNDAVLAAALWRNLFNGDKSDLVHVESALRYVRMQLYVLSKMSDREFGFGDFVFVKPDQFVKPLTPEEEAALKIKVKQVYESSDKLLPSQRSNLSLEE